MNDHAGKHWQLGLQNEMTTTDFNLKFQFVGRLMGNYDIAINIPRQNDMIINIANHVVILIEYGYFDCKY